MFLQMLANCTQIFPKIYGHQFNLKLYDGTLPATTFKFFLQQDKLYLCDFSEALAQLSTRFDGMKDTDKAEQFSALSRYVKAAELELHRDYLQDTHSVQFFKQPQPDTGKIQSIAQYTKYLLDTTNTASIEEAVACMLPCFWIYSELGKQMDIEKYNDEHPYKKWIATYSDKEFLSKTIALLQTLEGLTNSVSCPQHQEKIIAAFTNSANFELMFFDETMSDTREYVSACKEEYASVATLDSRL